MLKLLDSLELLVINGWETKTNLIQRKFVEKVTYYLNLTSRDQGHVDMNQFCWPAPQVAGHLKNCQKRHHFVRSCGFAFLPI